MKQIHIDATPGEDVYFIGTNGIHTGKVERVGLTNKGIEYTVISDFNSYWVGVVAATKEELLAKITASFSEGGVC